MNALASTDPLDCLRIVRLFVGGENTAGPSYSFVSTSGGPAPLTYVK